MGIEELPDIEADAVEEAVEPLQEMTERELDTEIVDQLERQDLEELEAELFGPEIEPLEAEPEQEAEGAGY